MSALFYTVTVPGTLVSLASLLQAASTWPTVSSAGQTYKMPTGPISQLLLSSIPGNTGTVAVSGAAVSGSDTILPGGSITIGSGSQMVTSLSLIFVQGSGGGGQALQVAWTA